MYLCFDIPGTIQPMPVRRTKKAPAKGAFSETDAGRYKWELADCGVRALTVAMNMDYADAHAALKAAGRKDKTGTSAATMTKAIPGSRFVSYWNNNLRPTYAQWIKAHKEGTYIVYVTGHLFAVIDGMQLDMGKALYKPRARMVGYWRLA